MIILTGGAGFIGSVLLGYLNEKGLNDIWLVDSLGTEHKWKNLRGKVFNSYSHKNEFLAELNSKTLPKIDAIFHLGACSSTTEPNAEYLIQNNFNFSKTLFNFAAERSIPFIYASSAATYGDGEIGFDDDPKLVEKLMPLNMYGYSKHIFDNYVMNSKVSSQVVGYKFFNVYGPNEAHKGSMRSVIYNSYYQILDKGSVKLFKSEKPEYKDGEQVRDFIYVKDIARVLYDTLRIPKMSGIFNLGTGNARTWNDLVGSVFSALNLDRKIEYIPLPDNLKDKYQYFTEAKVDRLKETGINCNFTSLEDGAKDYVQNYLRKDLFY
jgi:ADP-L-glycero-D-manno-heptose 6-epimerase